MIQDFQQLTERRIEGQCIYCTTNVFAYKKYCRMRLVLFAGATPANLQQQHTHTILCWPAASLQSTNDTQTRVLLFETPQLLSPLYLHSTPWNAGSTPTRTPIHSSGSRQSSETYSPTSSHHQRRSVLPDSIELCCRLRQILSMPKRSMLKTDEKNSSS